VEQKLVCEDGEGGLLGGNDWACNPGVKDKLEGQDALSGGDDPQDGEGTPPRANRDSDDILGNVDRDSDEDTDKAGWSDDTADVDWEPRDKDEVDWSADGEGEPRVVRGGDVGSCQMQVKHEWRHTHTHTHTPTF
jgi:hypothetical protein